MTFRKIVKIVLPEYLLDYVKKIYYVKLLKNYSLLDEPDLKIIQLLVTPGDYVIDIGANVGLYTKIFSQIVERNGRVFGIEPIPSTFNILCSNIHKLHLPNVEPLNYAMSDSNRSVTMEIPHYQTDGENYYRARIPKNNDKNKGLRKVEVQTKTIDSEFSDFSNQISFIKCDVEGHELECLKGANKFLENTQSAWLIEVAGDPDNSSSSAYFVFKILVEKGYSVWWFDGVKLQNRQSGDRSINYFFLRDDHIKTLRSKEPNLFG